MERRMVERQDGSGRCGRREEPGQRLELGIADDPVHGSRDETVQGDDPKAADVAHRRALLAAPIEQLTDVLAVRTDVPGAQYVGELRAPIVVPRRIQMRDAVLCGERSHPLAHKAAALRRPVIRYVTGDHDEIEPVERPTVTKDPVECSERVDTVLVEAGGRDMGIRQMKDSMRHEPTIRRIVGARSSLDPYHSGAVLGRA
jgi:hypothetical protein